MPMPLYRVHGQLRLAEKCAFAFVNFQKKLTSWVERKKETIAQIGGKVSPFWIFMSILGIVAAVGFGIYAAFNAQGAIAGIIDPLGNGTFPTWVYLVIGSAISVVGMVFGHFIYEGLTEGFNRDEHTGDRSLSGKIWYAVIGFTGATFYVGYQYYLVKSAGAGNANLVYLPYVVAGIAILELMIGGLILHRAFGYLFLFVATLIMAFITWRMNVNAKSTNDYYRQYLNFVTIHNRENLGATVEPEGNDNIRRAIAYYTGTKLEQEDPKKKDPLRDNDEPTQGGNTPAPTPDSGPTQPAQIASNNDNNTDEKLDSFLNDTTDEDLTA